MFKKIWILLLTINSFVVFSEKTDTTYIFKYYPKSKVISTKTTILTNEIHWGTAKAYKSNGELIYSYHIRNVGGHSSVDFTYYPNGTVKTAHYTGQPDGGIQREDVKHYFDENGNLTNIEDNSWGNDGHPSLIRTIPEIVNDTNTRVFIKETKPEVPKCAVIYSTEVNVVNLTGKKLLLKTKPFGGQGKDFIEETELNKGDSVRLGEYIEAQLFTPPKEKLQFTLLSTNKKELKNILFVWQEPKQVSQEKRTYYLYLLKN